MKSKIKKWEDAFKYLKLNPKDLPEVSMLSEKHRIAIIISYKLFIITEALNKESNGDKEWVPNWNDDNEWKYYPYFYIQADAKRPSGFGFSHSVCVSTCSFASVGSRLCFRTRELALYSAKQFEELYKEYLLILK